MRAPTKTTLRTMFFSAAAIAGVLGVVAASFLFLTARFLNESAASVDEAAQSIQAAEELQLNLRTFARLREGERRAFGPELTALVGAISAHVSTEGEARLVRLIDARIKDFANSRLTGEYLREIESALESLIRLNVEQAETSKTAILERANRIEAVGKVSLIVFVFATLALLIAMDRIVYRPLLRLTDAMAAFNKGRMESRAPAARATEIDTMGTTFNEMAATIERQKQTQVRSIAAIAHDLRNPLSAIMMSTEALRDGPTTGADPLVLDIVARQVGHLDRLVGDLLDTMRAESGNLALDKQPVDVATILRDAVTLHERVSPQHDLLFDAEGPLMASADPGRLSQVINNLISNAIKYSPEGGVVNVTGRRSGDAVEIEVKDSGRGISPEELDRIFEPFRRGGAARQDIPGVGLGLSTSRKIVEAHGGRITVDSLPGLGSTFVVRLPVSSLGPV